MKEQTPRHCLPPKVLGLIMCMIAFMGICCVCPGAAYAGPADGYYYINSAKAPSMCIDVKGGSSANDAPLQIYSRINSPDQIWKITQNREGSYKFQNVNSGLFITAPGANYTNRTIAVQQWGTSDVQQNWNIWDQGGNFSIGAKASSNQVLESAGGATSNWTAVQFYTWNMSEAQRWTFSQASLTGSVSLSTSSPRPGQSLSASLSGSNATGTAGPSCSYNWYCGGSYRGSGTSYTPTAADAGTSLYCQV
ncbi:MAG: RICIN domain-containing protein, partial [Ruthenibacterium sp.]